MCVTGKVSGFHRPPRPEDGHVVLAGPRASDDDDDETRLSEGKTFLFVLL